MDNIGKDIMTVIMAILSIAVLTLVIGQASKTSSLITSFGTAFNTILKTLTNPGS